MSEKCEHCEAAAAIEQDLRQRLENAEAWKMGAEVGGDEVRKERDRLRSALKTLWLHVTLTCGDWYLRAERRAIAMQVEDALLGRTSL